MNIIFEKKRTKIVIAKLIDNLKNSKDLIKAAEIMLGYCFWTGLYRRSKMGSLILAHFVTLTTTNSGDF